MVHKGVSAPHLVGGHKWDVDSVWLGGEGDVGFHLILPCPPSSLTPSPSPIGNGNLNKAQPFLWARNIRT